MTERRQVRAWQQEAAGRASGHWLGSRYTFPSLPVTFPRTANQTAVLWWKQTHVIWLVSLTRATFDESLLLYLSFRSAIGLISPVLQVPGTHAQLAVYLQPDVKYIKNNGGPPFVQEATLYHCS